MLVRPHRQTEYVPARHQPGELIRRLPAALPLAPAPPAELVELRCVDAEQPHRCLANREGVSIARAGHPGERLLGCGDGHH